MRTKSILLLVAAWGAVLVCGELVLGIHGVTPGRPANAVAASAAPAGITTRSSAMTLVMFVHPKCPCTAAGIEELSQIMRRCGPRVSASVVVFQPSSLPQNWSHTSNWQSAASIPGVTVQSDWDGWMARRCGARTSGQVFLYAGNGRLLFEGGITSSRGHVGSNDAVNAIIGLVLGTIRPGSAVRHAPVFGCAIY